MTKEKGTQSNWKNVHEGIRLCIFSKEYIFNIDKIKICQKVIMRYKENKNPKNF